MRDEIEDEVRAFVESNFYVGGKELGREESLLDAGVVDSTGVLELIAFLEDKYALQVSDDEVLPENLDSIASVARYVLRKRQNVSLTG